MNNLRRRGQTLCNHQDADESVRLKVQQTVKTTEEQWKKLLLTVNEVEAAAAAEVLQESQRRLLEVGSCGDL